MVIFCEGVKSEADYINGLKRLPEIRRNTAINIEIDPDQGAPLTLVERAIDRLGDDEMDECWCIFDVEWPQNHPNLPRALQRARDHGVNLAISNPCFELWLLLHFEEQTAFLETCHAERRSRHLEGRTGKGIDAARYMPSRAIAAERAKALARRHAANDTCFPRDNPSSTVYLLLDAIEP